MKPKTLPVSVYEALLRLALQRATRSRSHDLRHLDMVLRFAKQLGALYEADPDILTASVLLHDLGRNESTLHGPASAAASIRRAKPILDGLAMPEVMQRKILQNIADHDQPALRPKYLEGRILKDADFLSGFGATGIVRSAMWTGESGGSIDDFLQRIEIKMRQRIDSLEFPESKAYATTQYTFVRLFIDKFRHAPTALPRSPSPYIVIEGISGSGKTTQAALLKKYYDEQQRPAAMITEPSISYGHTADAIHASDHTTALLYFLVDRYQHIMPAINQARRLNMPVIADRSYVSTLVYQARKAWLSPESIVYMHSALPQPTKIIILDISAETAYQRICARSRRENIPFGKHETLTQLSMHRKRFLRIPMLLPNAAVLAVDDKSTSAVQAELRDMLQAS